MAPKRRITPHLEGQRLGAVRALAWGGVVLMAGAALSILPRILLFVILGRRVINSIPFSGYK